MTYITHIWMNKSLAITEMAVYVHGRPFTCCLCCKLHTSDTSIFAFFTNTSYLQCL